MKNGKCSLIKGIEEGKGTLFKVSFFSSARLIAFYIMHLLIEKSFCGKELMERIEEDSEGTWVPNSGFIYPILKKLSQEGLVEGKWSDRSKHKKCIYSITPEGEKIYKEVYPALKKDFEEFLGRLKKIEEEVFKE